MDASVLLRLRIEDLLFEEADLLDQWKLDEWLALYTDDARYFRSSDRPVRRRCRSEHVALLRFDDRNRMNERVIG